jgi:hypothetical protein
MEAFNPGEHIEVKEVRKHAELGSYSKTIRCYLNGDLTQIPQDEAQRILSLAFVRHLEYTRNMELATTPEAGAFLQERINTLERKLVEINFRTDGLKQVIKRIYNESICQKRALR